jgi:transposase
MKMEAKGYTAKEIAKILGISYDNVRKRIEKAKIKPITKDAIYPLDTPDKIKDVKAVGRPRKAAEPEPAKAASKKKAK